MKENLFLRATPSKGQKGDFYSIFLNLILLPLLCIPLFFSATALKNQTPPQDSQAIIYISENTIVYGSLEISNSVVVKIPKKNIPQQTELSKKKYITVQKQVVAKNLRKSQDLKILQDKIDNKIKNNFYSGSQESDFVQFVKVRYSSVAIPILNYSYPKALSSCKYESDVLKMQFEKQKFFTFLIHSQFLKNKNPFLRGPPYLI